MGIATFDDLWCKARGFGVTLFYIDGQDEQDKVVSPRFHPVLSCASMLNSSSSSLVNQATICFQTKPNLRQSTKSKARGFGVTLFYIDGQDKVVSPRFHPVLSCASMLNSSSFVLVNQATIYSILKAVRILNLQAILQSFITH